MTPDAALPAPPIASPARAAARRLALLPFVMVMFFTVSGGAYGLEDVVSLSGPGMALSLLVVTPLIWSLPIALMVGELQTAIPAPGGYYAWVKRAMGPFWGFQEAWWNWITSFVDMAIYPVLFADYLSSLLVQALGVHFLEEHPMARWAVTLVVIWTFALWNIRGARSVGSSSVVFAVVVLLPFGVMTLLGLAKLALDPSAFWLPWIPPERTVLGSFGTGLFVVMWCYLGWECLSTVTEDLEAPRRNYPLGVALTIPLVVAAYTLPVIAGLAASPEWTKWTAGYFPALATLLGGWWLGAWLAIGGLVSSVALFNALLLSISRLPFLLAEDGYLPQVITRRHPTTGAPWVAIVVCAAIYSCFTLSAFQSLVVLDVIVYSAALLLLFVALVVLRVTEPNLRRPLRVPGGWPGLVLVTLLPTGVVALGVYSTWAEEGTGVVWLSLAALASGPVAYVVLDRFVKKGRPSVPVDVEIDDAPGHP